MLRGPCATTEPRTPAEIQADLFASYLLMPTDRLRPELPPSPWRGWPTVYRLAGKFAVSPTAMVVRLENVTGLIATIQAYPSRAAGLAWPTTCCLH
jgi:Zn-dependent peptidase ImmA (M78 family)